MDPIASLLLACSGLFGVVLPHYVQTIADLIGDELTGLAQVLRLSPERWTALCTAPQRIAFGRVPAHADRTAGLAPLAARKGRRYRSPVCLAQPSADFPVALGSTDEAILRAGRHTGGQGAHAKAGTPMFLIAWRSRHVLCCRPREQTWLPTKPPSPPHGSPAVSSGMHLVRAPGFMDPDLGWERQRREDHNGGALLHLPR
jgi:hypothetical protein